MMENPDTVTTPNAVVRYNMHRMRLNLKVPMLMKKPRFVEVMKILRKKSANVRLQWRNLISNFPS
jgi:hypothetical protein